MAIEHLLPRIIRSLSGEAVLCRVDCDNFHEIREERLRSLAQKAADEVRQRGRSRTLVPMNPADRRIIHVTLADDPAVAVARQGGVTTVLLATTSPAASPVVAFKLGDRPRVVGEPVAIRFGVTGNLTTQAASLRVALQAGKAYADGWARYEVAQADYEKKKHEYEAAKPKPTKPADGAKPDEKKPDAAPKKDEPKAPEPPEKPRAVEALEPYRALFAGKIPALVEGAARMLGLSEASILAWASRNLPGFEADTLRLTQEQAVPLQVIRPEIAAAVRLAHPVPVFMGLELVHHPGVVEITPEQVIDMARAGREANVAGAILSWDLMHAPMEGVRALAAAL